MKKLNSFSALRPPPKKAKQIQESEDTIHEKLSSISLFYSSNFILPRIYIYSPDTFKTLPDKSYSIISMKPGEVV